MSCYVGPKISNSGLVFHYDMSNTSKSWKGAPTTNVVTNANMTGGWSLSNFSGSSATLTYETEDGIPHLKITNVVLGTGSPDYPRITDTTFTQTITDGFSVSFEAKGTPGEVIKLSLYSTGSTKITLTATLTGSWQQYTFNNQTTGFTLNQPYIRFDTTIAGSVRYIRRIQVEQKAFATPFVAGTRSTTQAILDLTVNNTITATSLTYAGNNTFSFTGTNSISIPSINFSQAQTIEIWLQPLENDATRRNPYNQAYGGYGTWTHEPSGAFNYYYGDAGSNNTPYIGHTSGFTVVQNEIAHLVSTRNTTTSQWYKNGVQSTSYSHSYLDLAADNNPILIGTGYAGGYIGNIFSVKLYNRALSLAEIQQNFEASRGRYGI